MDAVLDIIHRDWRLSISPSALGVVMTFVSFDGMSWPTPQCGDCGLQWRLRYAPEETITKSDMLAAAEIMCAYNSLIFKTQKDRNNICSRLRTAIELGVEE